MATTNKKPTGAAVPWKVNPLVRKWLGGLGTDESADAPDWDAWRDELKASGRLLKVGRVEVDRAVLEQRFGCISGRCSPSTARGRSRCCCADLEVDLEPIEARALDRFAEPLARYLARREPRLELKPGESGRFWCEEGSSMLRRPGDRCVFSRRDPQGRVRCHLHGFAREHGIEQNEVQPLTCRTFPLLLITMERGRVVLSVLARHSYKHVGSLPPGRFPCLSDPTLPPIYESMRGDLDWLFGPGFADELARLAQP